MNLVSAINKSGMFPFGIGRSLFETSFKEQNALIPEQDKELLEFDESKIRQKENITLTSGVIAIIGENGNQRFNEFKTYPDGWYGGKGKELSKASIFFLEQFVKSLPELRFYRPSIFMTLGGNISIGFEDKNAKSIEIEFFSDKAEYYIESLNDENFVKLANIFDLIDKVRNLLK